VFKFYMFSAYQFWSGFGSFQDVGSNAMYSLFGPLLGVINCDFMLQECKKHNTEN